MLKFISVALLVRMMIATAQVQKDIFIPVVFALLPHKSRNSYDEMFVMIKDALADRGLALSAEYFMSDFEQNSFSSFFPEVEPKGLPGNCYWKAGLESQEITALPFI